MIQQRPENNLKRKKKLFIPVFPYEYYNQHTRLHTTHFNFRFQIRKATDLL